MQRRRFLRTALLAGLSAAACGQKAKPRYDPKACPFCDQNPGKCLHCGGSAQCSYCGGSGKRTSQTIAAGGTAVRKTSYTEECPFCKGSGKCHYCQGSGKCRVCKGSAKLEKWEW